MLSPGEYNLKPEGTHNSKNLRDVVILEKQLLLMLYNRHTHQNTLPHVAPSCRRIQGSRQVHEIRVFACADRLALVHGPRIVDASIRRIGTLGLVFDAPTSLIGGSVASQESVTGAGKRGCHVRPSGSTITHEAALKDAWSVAVWSRGRWGCGCV